MIINEKYLQDIDDDDDDDVMSGQPSASRVMGNANVKFDHYVKICYSDTECDKRKLTAVLPFIHINP